MNKEQFIKELRQRLSKLPDYEINKTVAFYTESIDDRIEEGMSEESAVECIGNIDEVVSEILVEASLTSLIQNKIKESHNNSSNKTLWKILAICGFPIWFPLGIMLFAALFMVYISVWLVVISLFAVELSLLAASLGGLVGIVFCFTHGIIPGLILVSGGLMSLGLFILSIKPLISLSKQFIALTTLFLRKIKLLFVAKKEA